ncbi:hypothetical protein BDN72DRAFT_843297 [Pluteus cervinus]|uniref:Uncharacterized protein n=1 Tax=Pluteus cervinus TaxID=181527 RepID=A0ACD3ANT2_9AGAR|nr:hypothetical protein BDN72DRAFT_843297 [Pluteus cervinus]
MPIAGSVLPPARETPYFSDLDGLDAWAALPAPKIEGILPYSPRPTRLSAGEKGRMLVCHDYNGGYTENPFTRDYTFNYYSHCDVFVYFSHHRVTIPPPGWINAAHRQGAKMLGTLIFEGGSEPDCLRLCIGQYPAGANTPLSGSVPFPLSAQYATTLANLAYQRGFDGWLMNFEANLEGGGDQARAVSAWLTILQTEMEAKIGSHVETIWYDSVVTDGYVYYQNRLNALNLPFFLSSTGLFTNYGWYPDPSSGTDPKADMDYFDKLAPSLTGNTPTSKPEVSKKEINNIFLGIDMYGRGSYGGGGFGAYNALTHISPLQRKLSAALFAPGWTWESQQRNPGWNWDQWWSFDHSLWVGTGNDPAPSDPASAPGSEGPFVPIVSYFSLLGPPDPLDLPFFSTFSPGTGTGWFVGGAKVFQSTDGWEDLDKQTAVGDLVWPVPKVSWHTSRVGISLPVALAAIATDNAYMGGSSLKLVFNSLSPSPIWLPLQSLNITLAKEYQATVFYTAEQPDTILSLDLYVKPLGSDIPADFITVIPIPFIGPPAPSDAGWKKVAISFIALGLPATTTQVALGLVLSSPSADPYSLETSLLLGQISVVPSFPDAVSVVPPIILYANFQPDTSGAGATPSGILSWSIGAAIPPSGTSASDADAQSDVPSVSHRHRRHQQQQQQLTLAPKHANQNIDPNSTVSAWKIQPSNPWLPTLAYANIYAIRFVSTSPPTVPPTLGLVNSSWIGTSGLDGRTQSFVVVGDNLPPVSSWQDKVRFWVQGVTSRGELMNWDQCAYVDVDA